MQIRKTLTSIILAGTLTLGGFECSNSDDYFNGKIGEEQVRFYGREVVYGREVDFLKPENVLYVVKADGSKIKYRDVSRDSIVDIVEISSGDYTTGYPRYYTIYSSDSSNPVAREVVKQAQEGFNLYLSKITAIQTALVNGQ